MVRHRFLIPAFVGSNPASPANKRASRVEVFLLGWGCLVLAQRMVGSVMKRQRNGRCQAVPNLWGINCPAIYNPASPAKTDKSLEIASIPTSIHFALPLEFIVSHCFTHKNNSLDCFYLRSLYFTITYTGPCTVFFKKPIFSALHGLTFQKILILQCFYLGMSKNHPRERQMYSDSNLM